jgi:hypothetical protein
MDDRLNREQTLIQELESVIEDRNQKEKELDTIREFIEENSPNHPMDFLFSYLKHHGTRGSWKKAYTGQGFTNA